MKRSFCSRGFGFSTIVIFVLAIGFVSSPLQASTIATEDIVTLPSGMSGSGNGTLDLRMFTFSGSEIQNAAGAFNGDNGNNTIPQGGGADIDFFDESYVTTAGELKAYFDLNFASGSIGEIVIYLDLNETGGGEPNNTLVLFDIVLNPASIQGSPVPSGDVLSSEQAAIDQVYTGGTLLASLSPQPADNLPVNSQGAGFADYAIFTGINPFALNDSDVLLFNVSMALLNNGADELFLSGTYAPTDVPEPVTLVLLSMGGALLLKRRQRA